MPIQKFYLRGALIGSARRKATESYYADTEWRPDFPTRGVAYFCPRCNEVWFLAAVEGADTFCENRPCEDHHGNKPGVPGTIWSYIRGEDFLRALPKELRSRDLLLHIKYYEAIIKELADENNPAE